MLKRNKKNCMYHLLIMLLICLTICNMLVVTRLLAESDIPRNGYPSQYANEQTFNDYTVRTIFDYHTGIGTVEILHKNSQVYINTGESHFYIGQPGGDELAYDAAIEMGRDITGTGIPNLVISEWTLGMHCCFRFYVFELGETLQLLAKLDAEHSDLSHFVDVNNDIILEFLTSDWTFAYWRTSFASSPAPEVILQFSQGEYRLAFDLMKRSAPSSTEFEDMVQHIRSHLSWHQSKPPVELWETMLNLIYGGHVGLAWQLWNQAWVEDVEGKERFLVDFQTQLMKSPYWKDLQRLNKS